MIQNYLGLARKAGLVISGSDKVLEKIKTKAVKLVLISSDASSNTIKKFSDKAKYYLVDYLIIDNNILLKVYKENPPKVIGVLDLGLASKIRAIKGDESNG